MDTRPCITVNWWPRPGIYKANERDNAIADNQLLLYKIFDSEKYEIYINCFFIFYLNTINGAQEKTRTSTGLLPLGPEPSASTNSATWALTCDLLFTAFREEDEIIISS